MSNTNRNQHSQNRVSAWQVVKGFLDYYKPYMHIFIFDLFCAILVAAIDLAFPQFLRFVTNDFFTRPAEVILSALVPIAFGLLALYLIRSGAQYFITRWGHYMGVFMEADMRKDLFTQYQRLSFSYYDKHNSGDMLSRILTDLFDISELAHHGPENVIICSLKIIGSFILLFIISPLLTSILLVVTIIMVTWSAWLNYKCRVAFTENRQRMSQMSSQLQDSLGGIKTVKSFGNERKELSKFSSINHLYVDTRKNNYKFMATLFASNSFFTGLLYTITIVVGGFCVAQGTLAVNELAIFAIYIAIFIAPIDILIQLTEIFQKGYAGFRRFMEILAEYPDVIEKKDAIDFPDDVHMNIEYENVDFAYEDKGHSDSSIEVQQEKLVLNDLNLKINEGEKIALVGPSGQGKTTICALLSRFYDINDGCVKIGGCNIKDLKIDSLREKIGIVQQDIYLFDTSVAENISYGADNSSMDQVISAAKHACIHDFIMSLEDGYDTLVGERGTRLSGGQKQRIAIARLFMRDPKIVVLDEATSALDNESEAEVQKSLARLCEGRTTLIIAHRLSTIKSVDKIAVIDAGKVAEFGTHEELMALNGIYARYYNMQFNS